LLIVGLSLVPAQLLAQPPSGPTLFVSGFNDHTVRKVNSDNGVSEVIFNGSEDGVLTEDLVVGPDGKVYVCDPPNGRVYRMNQDGSEAELILSGTNPVILAEGPSFDGNTLYVNTRGNVGGASHTGVWKLQDIAAVPFGDPLPPPTQVLTEVQTGSVFGEGTTFAQDGALLVVDRSGGRVLRSAPPFTSVTPLITGLFLPFGVAVSPGGEIFVANSGTSSVLRFSAAGAPLGTYVTFGDTCEECAPDRPEFLEFDVSGVLYVTTSKSAPGDASSGKVWRVDAQESKLLLTNLDFAVGIAVALSTSRTTTTVTFDPNNPTQVIDFGPTVLRVEFPATVLNATSLQVSLHLVSPADLTADLPAGSTCFQQPGNSGLCSVLEFENAPKQHVDFSGRASIAVAIITGDQAEHPQLLHDTSLDDVSAFNEDILTHFSLFGDTPDGSTTPDPIGEGGTDNFGRFIFTNEKFEDVNFPCNIQPSQGENETFTVGSVVPFRFQLRNNSDCTGSFVPFANAMLTVVRRNEDGTVTLQPVVSPKFGDNAFRNNLAANRYEYNLKTNGFTTGEYCATIHFHNVQAGALPFTTCFNLVDVIP
jgi:sugar lactone lactonase YvrE